MHDDRDNSAFAVKPLLDIDAVVDAYAEADTIRQVVLRLKQRAYFDEKHATRAHEREAARRHARAAEILNQWADAREASVAEMLEG